MNNEELVKHIKEIEDEDRDLIDKLLDECNDLITEYNDIARKYSDIIIKINDILEPKKVKIIDFLKNVKEENKDCLYIYPGYDDISRITANYTGCTFREVSEDRKPKANIRFNDYTIVDICPSEIIGKYWNIFEDSDSKDLYLAMEEGKTALTYLPDNTPIKMLVRNSYNELEIFNVSYNKITNKLNYLDEKAQSYLFSARTKVIEYKFFKSEDDVNAYITENFAKNRKWRINWDDKVAYDDTSRTILRKKPFPDSDLEIKRVI